MNALTGGGNCGCGCSCCTECPTASCGCKYAGEQEGSDDPYYGGSSTTDNSNANGQNVQSSTENKLSQDLGSSVATNAEKGYAY